MNTFEAVAALYNGEKIHCNIWGNDEYLVLKDGKIIDEIGNSQSINVDPRDTHEWSIFEEPKEWYEIINNFPVVCRVWDDDTSNTLIMKVIIGYVSGKFIDLDEFNWGNCERLIILGNPVSSFDELQFDV